MRGLTANDHKAFQQDGFVVVEDCIDSNTVTRAQETFPKLFRGEFETGIEPDEWNWREGRDDPTLTRQICNGWRANSVIASIVLDTSIGRACAELRQWSGARLNQDNVIWKPPGARALGFHQDESYQTWNVPGEMMTCWITLDDTRINQGTIEYVKGSHLWPLSPAIRQFHGPDDPIADLIMASKAADAVPEMTPIVVTAGSCVLHHGRTWHGSKSNLGDRPRRSIVAHCMPSNSQFHPTEDHPIYGRYRQDETLDMNSDDFPILWPRSESD